MIKKFPRVTFCLIIFSIFSEVVFSQTPQQNFCRSGLNIPVNDHSSVVDSINVFLGNGCIVNDVNAVLTNINHTWVSDLRIYLRKGNTGALIVNFVGGSGDNFINTVLDDSALIPLSSGTAPFTGTYRPSTPLAPFNGINTDGYWKIVVTDTGNSGDTGSLHAWCVRITYTCPTGGIQTVEIPNTYRLYQNYPNPFNPVTRIKYGLPKNGYVKLTVYDELGREIGVLQDGYQQANTYEAVFDATNLPSGVYYYKLEASSFSETKKMVIIK
ncbi:MAG TPA: T9SS type A sorting domain-containing protein [Ignavibacteria bacterium]|nr:T9SS type A sorting domain-containing protein [Ignavibacteria bacterium]